MYLVLVFGAFKCLAVVEKVVLWSIMKSSKSFTTKPFYACTNAEILADFQNSHGHCMLKYWEIIIFVVFCYSDTENILYSAPLKSQRQGLSVFSSSCEWQDSAACEKNYRWKTQRFTEVRGQNNGKNLMMVFCNPVGQTQCLCCFLDTSEWKAKQSTFWKKLFWEGEKNMQNEEKAQQTLLLCLLAEVLFYLHELSSFEILSKTNLCGFVNKTVYKYTFNCSE